MNQLGMVKPHQDLPGDERGSIGAHKPKRLFFSGAALNGDLGSRRNRGEVLTETDRLSPGAPLRPDERTRLVAPKCKSCYG